MRDDFCDCDDCTGKTEIAALRAALHALATGLRWEEELRAWVLTDLGALTKARAALAPRSERREGEPGVGRVDCACGETWQEAGGWAAQGLTTDEPGGEMKHHGLDRCEMDAPPAAPKGEA